MIKQNGLKLAYLAAVLNATIIGFSFLFVKVALEYTSPFDMLAYRFSASFAGMSIPVIFGWIKLNYHGKPLYKVLLLATMYPLGFFTFQTFGLEHATSAAGGILFAFTPIATMILASIFLKERTTLLQKLSIFMSVFGVVFIFIMKGSSLNLSNLTGIFLLLTSCMAVAGYSVLARSLLKTFTPVEISYFMLGTGFIVFLVISLTNHSITGTLDDFFVPLTSGTFILSIFYLGVMSTLITALATSYALSKIEASQANVFTNLSTIIAIAAGVIFLDENISTYHIIGSGLIIAGVLGTNLLGQKMQNEDSTNALRERAN
ncbi:DMT family transporter [Alkalihalobacillus sp. TS-13]|uniref:DMT family transporter n=1 Tax=Alkalihalobacillus sp. TS-13 TaxID=2842455 RepID=UPI001C87FBE3|nr:DMT family transporter [Alkalihalobacillus sp. TS-13]